MKTIIMNLIVLRRLKSIKHGLESERIHQMAPLLYNLNGFTTYYHNMKCVSPRSTLLLRLTVLTGLSPQTPGYCTSLSCASACRDVHAWPRCYPEKGPSRNRICDSEVHVYKDHTLAVLNQVATKARLFFNPWVNFGHLILFSTSKGYRNALLHHKKSLSSRN